jgi:tetratricopeptide (TPR) repeat protein
MKTILLLIVLTSLSHAADPQKAAQHWQKSLEAESSSDYPKALELTAAYKAAGGDSYLASVRSGWLHYQARDFEKAITFYQAASKLEPRAITPHLGLVSIYQAQSKPKETLSAAANGLKVDAFNHPLLLVAGELLYNQKDYRKAETLFDRAHHLKPEDATTLSWLGWAQIMQGQVRLAAPMFERLMHINPTGYMVQQGYNISHGIPPPSLQANNRRP